MKKEILTRITIPAQPDEAWGALTDIASYADRNPFVQRIKGCFEIQKTVAAGS